MSDEWQQVAKEFGHGMWTTKFLEGPAAGLYSTSNETIRRMAEEIIVLRKQIRKLVLGFNVSEHCEHKNTKTWEPHLAGARKCLDCGKVKYRQSSTEWVLECEHKNKSLLQSECESAMPTIWRDCLDCGKRLIAEWEESDVAP